MSYVNQITLDNKSSTQNYNEKEGQYTARPIPSTKLLHDSTVTLVQCACYRYSDVHKFS